MLLAVTAINVVLTTLLGLLLSFKEVEIPQYIRALIIGLGAYLIPIMIYAFRNGITAKAAEEKFCFKGCGFGGIYQGSGIYAPAGTGFLSDTIYHVHCHVCYRAGSAGYET